MRVLVTPTEALNHGWDAACMERLWLSVHEHDAAPLLQLESPEACLGGHAARARARESRRRDSGRMCHGFTVHPTAAAALTFFSCLLIYQVGVRVEEEDMCTGARHHCCSAYLTFVSVLARGGAGRPPRPLPRLAPTSRLHGQIYEAAEQCAALCSLCRQLFSAAPPVQPTPGTK